MNREQLEKLRELLKDLRHATGPSAVLKRAALIALVLEVMRSTAALAEGGEADELLKALDPGVNRGELLFPWQNWNDWNNWSDWKDWNDWNNWNDWKDWNDWQNTVP